MTQRSTIDKHFKPRNSNNSRLVFICINSYIKPCVIFWHRSELRNGVGWSLLPKIWLTISGVGGLGKTDETDERIQGNRWAGPGGSRPRVYMHMLQEYHQRDRIHFFAVSHTDKCRSPVPKSDAPYTAVYRVYRHLTEIGRGR